MKPIALVVSLLLMAPSLRAQERVELPPPPGHGMKQAGRLLMALAIGNLVVATAFAVAAARLERCTDSFDRCGDVIPLWSSVAFAAGTIGVLLSLVAIPVYAVGATRVARAQLFIGSQSGVRVTF